LHIFKLKDN